MSVLAAMKSRKGIRMQHLIMGILAVLVLGSTSHAFEIDGFKSGMSVGEAQKQLEAYSYKNIKQEGNNITAYYHSVKSPRLFNLNFCKGVLVQVQKELDPSFDRFVRLIDEKRKELGRPVDAWSNRADATASLEKSSITFIWKNGKTLIQASYKEFPSNNFLDIVYEEKNECWKIPY